MNYLKPHHKLKKTRQRQNKIELFPGFLKCVIRVSRKITTKTVETFEVGYLFGHFVCACVCGVAKNCPLPG